MITILLEATLSESWGRVVELRTDVDLWEKKPVLGTYHVAERVWKFVLNTAVYAAGFKFKFVMRPDMWQAGPNLELRADEIVDGKTYPYVAKNFDFEQPRPTVPPIELGWAHRRLFGQPVATEILWDVIVIGSGMAGGTLADHLSDGHPDGNGARDGLNVLLLEAGGFVFPTHIGNLPREQTPGVLSKHIWELWDEFSVRNYDNLQGSDYDGGQAFNLGGRSVFWGGFIPRMTSWELDQWPKRVKYYLEDTGYIRAEDFMGRSTGPRTIYNRQVHLLLRELFHWMNHVDAPMAIRQNPEAANTIATGVFSTADLITESLLTRSGSGREGLSVLLNHQAIKVISDTNEARVMARDLRLDREVSLRGKTVVLCAGCLESARLANRSELPDPHGLIGKGTSDHPIYFTHFSIPNDSPYFDPYGNVKTLSQPKEGSDPKKRLPCNLLLELGADLNHGRYLDEDIFREHLANRKRKMLCELVFLCNEQLLETNAVTFLPGDAEFRPQVLIQKYPRQKLRAVVEEIKWPLLRALGAQPKDGPRFDPIADEAKWKAALSASEGRPGGVAHEVGSLRMQIEDESGNVVKAGVVDERGTYLGLEAGNIFVCDLSIFPTTPAANPSLTVVALAIRLAEHLRNKLGTPPPSLPVPVEFDANV